MAITLTPIDRAKYAAARRAVDLVEDGMKLGLGTGSTAAWMVRVLAERARAENLRLTCVPTSVRTGDLARELGLKVVALDEAGWLDLTIDGTDEFDADLALIKGGGGALLMEKIVATASDRMVVITDATKEVKALGGFPLPVEVIPFGWQASRMLIEELLGGMDVMGTQTTLRKRKRSMAARPAGEIRSAQLSGSGLCTTRGRPVRSTIDVMPIEERLTRPVPNASSTLRCTPGTRSKCPTASHHAPSSLTRPSEQ